MDAFDEILILTAVMDAKRLRREGSQWAVTNGPRHEHNVADNTWFKTGEREQGADHVTGPRPVTTKSLNYASDGEAASSLKKTL